MYACMRRPSKATQASDQRKLSLEPPEESTTGVTGLKPVASRSGAACAGLPDFVWGLRHEWKRSLKRSLFRPEGRSMAKSVNDKPMLSSISARMSAVPPPRLPPLPAGPGPPIVMLMLSWRSFTISRCSAGRSGGWIFGKLTMPERTPEPGLLVTPFGRKPSERLLVPASPPFADCCDPRKGWWKSELSTHAEPAKPTVLTLPPPWFLGVSSSV